MRIFRSLLATALAGLSLLPAACDRFGGLGSSEAPDEFAVIPNRPLAMPPGLGLPTPQPGAPSPLAPNPAREAQIALLGGPAVRPAAQAITPAEAALLASANANTASNDIRTVLARDSVDDDGPYEAPTIFELFGGGRDDGARLDPQDEARRLQRSGLAAPTDPLAEPPEEAPEADAPADAEEETFRVFRAPRQVIRP